MTGIQRIEHAKLRVEELDSALEFYTDIVGMVELGRTADEIYLGCGVDDRYDLVLTEGGTGVDHFALRVDDRETLDKYADSVADHGVETDRTHKTTAGIGEGVRFSLPSGVEAELVTVDDHGYRRPTDANPERGSHTPVDLDHITLMSTSIQDDVEFLTEPLGFRISEVHELPEGGWRFAWTRFGHQHHDVALVNGDALDETLHHLAFTMSSLSHMKSFLDTMAARDHSLEVGINRHTVGQNLFSYFRAPGGNRIELSTEIATLDDATETRVNEHEVDTLTAWGGIAAPETFREGS